MNKSKLLLVSIIAIGGLAIGQQAINPDEIEQLPQVIRVNETVDIKTGYREGEQGQPESQIKNEPQQWLVPIQAQVEYQLKPGEEWLYPDNVPARLFLHPADRSEFHYFSEYINPNPHVQGEMVIQFKETVRNKLQVIESNGIVRFNLEAVDALNQKFGATQADRIIPDENMPANGFEFRLDLIYLVRMPLGLNMEEVAAQYRSLAGVKGASPNYIPQKAGDARNVSKTYPDDPDFDWAGNIQQSPEAFAAINWTNVNTDTLAILDVDPFNGTHADLSGNFAAGSGTSWSSNASGNHGTMCMGPASARCNNTTGMTGTAGGWGTTKGLALLVYRFTSHAENIAGITWARNNGACAISQSSLYLSEPAGLEDAFASALAGGVASAAAAGNSGSSDVSWPACFDCVISVGGTTNTDEIVNFSTYGSNIDVVAPADDQWITDGTSYVLGGGTSFAAPRVAATCGLIANVLGIRGQAVKDVLFRTIDDIRYLTPGYENIMGRGRLNVYEALKARDKNACVSWLGFDMLNNKPFMNPYGVFADFDIRDSLNFRNSKELIPHTPIIPKVYVQNKGRIGTSFNVTCTIDSLTTNKYTQTVLVSGIQPGQGQIVYFPQFTPKAETYTVRTYTSLVGDQNTSNDTIALVTVSQYTDTMQYDIGNWQRYYSDDWLEWGVRFSPVNPCSVKSAQVYIHANTAARCTLVIYDNDPISNTPRSRIFSQRTASYSTSGWKTEALSTVQYFTKDFWVVIKTPGTPGTSTYNQVTCDPFHDSKKGMVKLGTKWYSMGEDLLIRAFVRYPAFQVNDYAVVSIDNPLATVYPDTAQVTKGANLVFKATVMNRGINSQTNVVVRCLIDSAGTNRYNQTRQVSLGPGEYTQITYNTLWIPNWESNTYNMRVISELGTDTYRANDTVKVNIFNSSTSQIVYAREDQFVTHLGLTSAVTDQFAERFTPAAYPCSLVAAYYWPYSQDSLFRPKVWDDDGASGVPGTVLCSLATWDPPGQQSYVFCDLPDVRISSGDFYIGLSETVDNINLGIDTVPPTDYRAYCQYSTNPWRNLNDISAWGGDWFIKAVVYSASAPPSKDAAVQSLDYPIAANNLSPNFAVIPKATIKNTGNNSITENVTVTCRFDTSNVQVYSNSKIAGFTAGNPLLPGATYQLSFDPFTPTTVDTYYEDSVWLLLLGDMNANNNYKEDSFFCSSLDIIDYWSAGEGTAALGGNDPYHATRFTADLPCSLYAAWVRMQDTTTRWTSYCTTYVWNNRVDGKLWPGQRVFSEGWRGSDLGLNGAVGAWIRRDISPRPYYDIGQNFWIGFYCPDTGKHQPDILLCDWSSYGRSFYDDEIDSTFWWQLSVIDTVIGTDTITCAAEWLIEALVKNLGGASHALRGNIISTTTQDSLHFRSYLSKNPEQTLTETSAGGAISQIEANKALWQVDCKYFWPNWTNRDRVFTIIDYEANSGTSGHIGYYAAIIDTLILTANPQDAPACTLRAIPRPAYNVIQWTASMKILRIHWNPANKDIGKPDTTYAVGYNVYRSLDDAVNLPFRKTMGSGLNDTVFTDTLYPPWGTHYYAIKILYAGHTFGKNPATIESRYLSENLPVSTIGIEEETQPALPLVFALEAPQPNPFTGRSLIRYAVPRKSHVSIKLYDATGRLAITVIDAELRPGYYEFRLDKKEIASGVYFCKMSASDFSAVKKLIHVR